MLFVGPPSGVSGAEATQLGASSCSIWGRGYRALDPLEVQATWSLLSSCYKSTIS